MADTVFCGVFDGHGPYGHIVAKRVRDLLPLKLGSHLESYVSCEEVLKEISLNTGDRKISENLVHISANGESRVYNKDYVKDQDMIQTLIGSIVKAYRFMDKELKMQVDVDCFCSGTTAVTMVKQVVGPKVLMLFLSLLHKIIFICLDCLFIFFGFLLGSTSCYRKYWGFKSSIGYEEQRR